MKTLSDHETAFALSMCLAYVHDIKRLEPGQTEKGKSKLKVLRRLEGDLVKLTHKYLPEDGFPAKDVRKADKMVDTINGIIRKAYLVGTDASRAARVRRK